MKLTDEQFEQIEAYLNNQMSEADKEVFETELMRSIELKNEVQTQKELRLGFALIALEKRIKDANNRFKNNEKVVPEKVQVEKQIRPIFSFKHISAAAVVLLCVGVGWYFQNNRISDDAYDFSEKEILNKSYDLDKSKGSQLPANSIQSKQRADWFLALTFIQKKEKQKAVMVLEKIAATEGHLYQTKAKDLLEKMK